MFRAFTAASILALTITPARADPAIEVKFGDLDLSKPSDVSILQDRVREAANGVCGQLLQPYSTSLYYRTWFKDCMRATSVETTKLVEAKAGHYRAFAKN